MNDNASNNPLEMEESDNIDYNTFEKYLSDDVLRNKYNIGNNIVEMGDELLTEIEEKKARNDLIKADYVERILKRDKGHKYSKKSLMKYSLEDVKNIYIEVKIANRSKFVKLIHFLLNIE